MKELSNRYNNLTRGFKKMIEDQKANEHKIERLNDMIAENSKRIVELEKENKDLKAITNKHYEDFGEVKALSSRVGEMEI